LLCTSFPFFLFFSLPRLPFYFISLHLFFHFYKFPFHNIPSITYRSL
jgi:hypothetical protein